MATWGAEMVEAVKRELNRQNFKDISELQVFIQSHTLPALSGALYFQNKKALRREAGLEEEPPAEPSVPPIAMPTSASTSVVSNLSISQIAQPEPQNPQVSSMKFTLKLPSVDHVALANAKERIRSRSSWNHLNSDSIKLMNKVLHKFNSTIFRDLSTCQDYIRSEMLPALNGELFPQHRDHLCQEADLVVLTSSAAVAYLPMHSSVKSSIAKEPEVRRHSCFANISTEKSFKV